MEIVKWDLFPVLNGFKVWIVLHFVTSFCLSLSYSFHLFLTEIEGYIIHPVKNKWLLKLLSLFCPVCLLDIYPDGFSNTFVSRPPLLSSLLYISLFFQRDCLQIWRIIYIFLSNLCKSFEFSVVNKTMKYNFKNKKYNYLHYLII